MKILGISAFYHDSAVALVENGDILFAAQEERYSRKKHDSSFPELALSACVSHLKLDPSSIDRIVFFEKPLPKFERLLETYFAFAPRGFQSFRHAMGVWLGGKLFQRRLIVKEIGKILGNSDSWLDKLSFSDHHLSHAASAFYPSPFESAAVLTIDGVGEWTTTSISRGQGSSLQAIEEVRFPHSLGLLYSAFTYFTGFKVNSGEYKLMGLAPYGRPVFVEKIKEHLVHIRQDGSFQLNMDYFNFATGLTMTNQKFSKLFGGPPRKVESPVTQRELDLAASIQTVTEEMLLGLARRARTITGEKNLCLAGGVALNCVANSTLLREEIFENVWIQPAAGDAGGALGAALASYFLAPSETASPERKTGSDNMQGAYLGNEYSQTEIEERLRQLGANFEVVMDDEALNRLVSEDLQAGKAVGWFQGRMEFGPRALGNRSILADPRRPDVQKSLNLKVKFRESFRPFAPSILSEQVGEWFDLGADSPYMLLTAEVASEKKIALSENDATKEGMDLLYVLRSEIPAVTHVDYSARVQTVHLSTNPRYHGLISEFFRATGCPILVNTSFNVRGEPIVESPDDAYRCFMGTGIESLVVGNCYLRKSDQPAELALSYEQKYELD